MTLATDQTPLARSVVLQPYNKYGAEAWRRRLAFFIIAGFALFCLPYGFFYALVVPYLFIFFMAPLAILAVIAIWALPDMRRAPTALLPPLMFTFVTALVLWPNYLAIALPGLPWITMIRLTTFPMTFAFLICISVSEQFRLDMARVLKATPPLWKAMLLFALVQFLSLAFSKNLTQSFQRILVAQTAWTGIFFISAYVFLKPGRVRRWAMILWIMAIVVGCIGMLETKTHQVLWGSHIPSFLRVGDEVVQRILAGATRSTTGQYRIQATFSTALGLSEYCALTLPFILHFLAITKNWLVRLGAFLTVPFLLIVIVNTDARLGLLGFFLSLMVYLFLWGLLRWTRNRDSLIGPATVLAYPIIFCAAVSATFVVGRIRNKVWGSGQYSASNEGRMAQVRAGTPKVLDHPFGHGVGMGGDALGYSNKAGVQTVDSYLLQVGMDVGIVGLLIYCALLILPIYYAIKYAFKEPARHGENTFLVPLAVSLINFTAIKFIFANDDNHPLMFMMLGIVIALVYRVRAELDPNFTETKARAPATYRRPLFRPASIPRFGKES